MEGKTAQTTTQELQLLKTNQKKKTVFKIRNRNSNLPLDTDEVYKLITAVDSLRDKTLLVLGFNSGMRVSEVTNIPWVAVDSGEGYIRIWDEKKDRYRSVCVPDETFTALELYRKTVKQEKVFEFSTKTAENIIQKWTTKILGKKKSWHCTRHTYITLSAIAGQNISIISENTGDSINTIFKYYVNLPPQIKRKLVNEKTIFTEKKVV